LIHRKSVPAGSGEHFPEHRIAGTPPMNTTDATLTAALRARLEARARELQAELVVAHDKWREGVDADRSGVIDQKDLANDQARAETDAGEADRDYAELQAVKAALERIAEGRYGECVDCGEPIAAARLLALPEAARCAACQQAREHGHTTG
jgi:RNA polymerase-binding transcription factor DksA